MYVFFFVKTGFVFHCLIGQYCPVISVMRDGVKKYRNIYVDRETKGSQIPTNTSKTFTYPGAAKQRRICKFPRPAFVDFSQPDRILHLKCGRFPACLSSPRYVDVDGHTAANEIRWSANRRSCTFPTLCTLPPTQPRRCRQLGELDAKHWPDKYPTQPDKGRRTERNIERERERRE